MLEKRSYECMQVFNMAKFMLDINKNTGYDLKISRRLAASTRDRTEVCSELTLMVAPEDFINNMATISLMAIGARD